MININIILYYIIMKKSKQLTKKTSKKYKKIGGTPNSQEIFNLLDHDVQTKIGTIVAKRRYELELEKAKQKTDNMVQEFTNNDDLHKLIKEFYYNGFEPNLALNSIIQIWGKNEYKKSALKYIDENIEIPQIVKIIYIAVLDKILDAGLQDCINWPEGVLFILMFDGDDYLINRFIEFIRDLEDDINYNDIHYWGPLIELQIKDVYIEEYTELEKEQFLHIFLSHLNFNIVF